MSKWPFILFWNAIGISSIFFISGNSSYLLNDLYSIFSKNITFYNIIIIFKYNMINFYYNLFMINRGLKKAI